MFEFITSNLIWTESLWLVLIFAIIALIGWFIARPITYLAVFAFLFCFYFFRNPERMSPEASIDETVIVCPADGKIVDIQYDPHGGFNGYHQKISIFLSPLDVHVNWTPVAGVVEKIEYVPGKFTMAFLPKSSELNEHNDVIIRRADGKSILVRQIAGTMARRIVCWVKEEQRVSAGQKYGMIKFSSRVDLLLPEQAQLTVKMGQKVYGGKTVIGRLA
ncbi:MAG: phosphatidylserine decarboxylase proenzyme [Candidatus Babeliales bacterium]